MSNISLFRPLLIIFVSFPLRSEHHTRGQDRRIIFLYMKSFNILVQDLRELITDCIKVEKINQDINWNDLPESLWQELISKLGKLKITSKNWNIIYALWHNYSITK